MRRRPSWLKLPGSENNFMKCLKVLSSLLLVFAAGCKPESAAPDPGNASVKSYDARGIVRQVASDRHEATIQHQAIPNFMAAMTMAFTVRNTNELQNLAPGDEITFKLFVTETNSWIESVRFV